MENKKIEKKRIFSKLTVGVAALALISCAFVGGTFARYQSSGVVDNGGANIADWYIDVQDGSGEAETMFTISPSEEKWGEGSTTGARVNTASDGGAILTFVNRGEVTATIEVYKEDALKVYGKKWVDATTNADGTTTAAGWQEYELTQDFEGTDVSGNQFKWQAVSGADTALKPLFVGENNTYAASAEWTDVALLASAVGANSMLTLGPIVFKSVDKEEAGAGQITVTGEGTSAKPWSVTLEPGEEISVTMGETIWTSDFGTLDNTYTGDAADLRDTWVGQNISRIGYSFTWKAVQASHLPEEGNVTGGQATPNP